jgi:hypothetical protein
MIESKIFVISSSAKAARIAFFALWLWTITLFPGFLLMQFVFNILMIIDAIS